MSHEVEAPLGSARDTRAAQVLLACCLEGTRWPEALLARLIDGPHSHLLFRIVIEGLSDRFEPRLCDTYADLFSRVIAHLTPAFRASDLRERYERIRRPRRFTGDPAAVRRVFVLSRVTLGADVAVTSVLMAAAGRAFPNASVALVGPRKCWELFAGDPSIGHVPVEYVRRGTLRDRLAIWPGLRQALDGADSIVIDPDSRLTQLGLLPVCEEARYFFFESRAYGGSGDDSLSALAARWAEETFGVHGAAPFVCPPAPPQPEAAREVTVSLGVGENPGKRVDDPFEASLLAYLAQGHGRVLIDRGGGGEEAARVERAVAGHDGAVHMYEGPFSGFAAQMAGSRLYVGYDSAGGHTAAALGVPAVVVFAGFASARALARWRPTGPGPVRVVAADAHDPTRALAGTLAAIAASRASMGSSHGAIHGRLVS